MAARVSARLSAAAGRRFGLTVGGAFLFIALIMWWRDHLLASRMLGGTGAALVLAALLVPGRLGPIEHAWMALAHAISKVTTPIVMGIIYLLVLTPAGALRRLLGGNPLRHEAEGQSYWKPRPPGARRTGSLRRQF